MSTNSPSLAGALESLERSMLIRRLPDQDQTFAFKHSLTQETAYQSLLQKRRREIHREIGLAYESICGDEIEEYAPVLARHFSEAGDDARTINYASLAGDAAARAYSSAEALMHYQLALAALNRQTGEVGNASQLEELYLKLGRVYEVANRHPEALAVYQQMEAQARERGERHMELAALLARATVQSIPSGVANMEEGEELANRAIDIARELGAHEAEAKGEWILCLTAYFAGRLDDSIRHGERSLAIARRSGLRERLAYALSDLSRSYLAIGKADNAMATAEESAALWRELGNIPLLIDILVNSSNCYAAVGDWEKTSALLDEAKVLADRIDNSWSRTYILMSWAMMSFIRGEIGKALDHCREAIRFGELAGAKFGVGFGIFLTARMLTDLAEGHKALAFIEEGLGYFKTSITALIPMVSAFKAEALLSIGDVQAAVDAIEQARPHYDPRNFDAFQPFFVAHAESEVEMARGNFQQAAEVVDATIGRMAAVGVRVCVGALLEVKGRALVGLRRLDEALAILREAAQHAEATQEKLVLLRIVSSLIDLERRCGNAEESRAVQEQALRVLAALTEEIPLEYRSNFLALAYVRAIAG